MKNRLRFGVTALVMAICLCAEAAPAAHASSDGVTIEIDKIVLTMDDLAEMEYTVPVCVNITENAGFNAAEFGVTVDERCRFAADIKSMDYSSGYAVSSNSLTWRALATSENWTKTGSVLQLTVSIPEDAQAGDVYAITYTPQSYKNHVWGSVNPIRDYVDADAVQWIDGYIRIADVEHPDPADLLFTENRDNWSFLNSYMSFGTGKYYMTDAHYEKLVSGLTNKEKEKIDDLLQDNWHGSCYGMAVTSILAFNDILKPDQYQDGADHLYDISNPPSDEVRSLIHYYYALQKTDAVQQMVASAVYDTPESEKLKKLISCLSDDSPTLLTYLDYEWGGHAVVAYDVSYGLYALNGRSYNGKVVVYDSNSATLNDNYCLYFSTIDWTWCIPGYELSSADGSFLGIVTDDLEIINGHGYIDGTEISSDTDYIPVLNSAPLQTEYTISRNSEPSSSLTMGENGSMKAYSSITSDLETQELCFALPDAAEGYTMELDSAQPLSLSMDYEDSLLKIDADAASTAVFDPSGYVEMQGDAADYTFRMVFNESSTSGYHSFTVEGRNAESAAMERTDEGYLLRASNLSGVSVSALGDEASAVMGFTADYDEVLLYEIDGTSIGAAADTDGDGTFESVIATTADLVSGDLTLDSTFSVTDVIALHKNLLGAERLTAVQSHNADLDGDGRATLNDSIKMMCTLLGA